MYLVSDILVLDASRARYSYVLSGPYKDIKV
jgi:hypothetical protein